MSARKKAPRKRPIADYLKGAPPVDEAERTLLRTLQRAADLEFALRETQGALRKVIHHTTTEAPNDAYRLGMVQAAAEEGLLRADNALGTVQPRRRATDKPASGSLRECTLRFDSGAEPVIPQPGPLLRSPLFGRKRRHA